MNEKRASYLNLYVGLTILFALIKAYGDDSILLSPLRWIIILWSGFYYMKAVHNFKKEPLYIKSLVILYFLFFIYGCAIIIEGKTYTVGIMNPQEVSNKAYLFKASISLLPIFAFYNYSISGMLNRMYIEKRIMLFVAVMFICYYFRYLHQLASHGDDEFTNNSGYLVLSIIPMLMLLKFKSKKQIIALVLCLLLILFSMKRGAILISCIVVFLYFKSIIRNSHKKTRIQAYVILAIFFFIAIFAVMYLYENNTYFNTRIEYSMEGGSSNRDIIYGTIVAFYVELSSLKEILFGYGANGTLELFGWYAHNDWFEIIINQGVLGVLIYAYYWVGFYKLCKKRNSDNSIKMALWMLFSIYFLKTLFSMSYDQYTLYSSMALGYCIARTYPKRKIKGGVLVPMSSKNNQTIS